MAYFSLVELEDQMSADVVRQHIDDNNDGTADATPFARLAADCQSYVDSYLRGIYALPLTPSVPNIVKMLALDVAQWKLWKRHPECSRGSWAELKEVTDKDLMNLRKGVTRLDVEGPPEPAANQGGFVGSGNPNAVEVLPKFALDGTGDF